jgi:hypothetical protein
VTETEDGLHGNLNGRSTPNAGFDVVNMAKLHVRIHEVAVSHDGGEVVRGGEGISVVPKTVDIALARALEDRTDSLLGLLGNEGMSEVFRYDKTWSNLSADRAIL